MEKTLSTTQQIELKEKYLSIIQNKTKEIDLWLSMNRYSEDRHQMLIKKTNLSKLYSKIKCQLSKLIRDRSDAESAAKIEAVRISRDQMSLLFRCYTVFSDLEKRGIGFDIRGKKVLEDLKKVVL